MAKVLDDRRGSGSGRYCRLLTDISPYLHKGHNAIAIHALQLTIDRPPAVALDGQLEFPMAAKSLWPTLVIGGQAISTIITACSGTKRSLTTPIGPSRNWLQRKNGVHKSTCRRGL